MKAWLNPNRRRICAGGVTLGVLLAFPAFALAAGTGNQHVAPPASQGHGYRHGVVPLRGRPSSTTTSANDLNYGGGISGIGVTTGTPRVYLVFWGSQWGTQSTNAQGNITLSGDPKGMAPYVEGFMKGVGTNAEKWSGVMTQYCQGVTAGAQSCPASNTQHVGYPVAGAFAGVWADESAAAPAQATGHQLGA